MESYGRLWITWERQRRSIVLAKEFNAEYYELLSSAHSFSRYISLSVKTFLILYNKKPRILFVQNPSIILAFIASLYRLFSYRCFLIVDRHSNFFPISNSFVVNKLHKVLSTFTLQTADLTIVTNKYLKQLVTFSGGKGYVLQDKIPNLQKTNEIHLKGKFNVLYICSFDMDEPFKEVFKAAELVNPDTYIYVTGNFSKITNENILSSLPKNLFLLGYLNDTDYVDYLYAADALIVLSEWEHTLLCGAYEGVALEKPLILSNKKDLLKYFNLGVITTENNAISIYRAINSTIKTKGQLEDQIKLLKSRLIAKWQIKFRHLNQLIDSKITTAQRS